MSSVVTQILLRLDAILQANVLTGTKVFRDRADAFSREEGNTVNVVTRDDAVESFAREMDKHETTVDLRFSVRDDDPVIAVQAQHAAVHRAIVTDSQLLALCDSVRLQPASFERDEADLTSLIKSQHYRFTYSIPQETL